MTIQVRNNVHVSGNGSGPATLFFVHGFGCDQNMWRLLKPHFEGRYRTVAFDLVGSGHSDISAYDPEKYASLQGYADDAAEIIRAYGQGPVVFVGHSVSAMIGLLADVSSPGLIAAHVMVSPSPCYINDEGYVGGFERSDIDSLLNTLETNYLGWSSAMAPTVMGAPDQPELGTELTNSFCKTDPDIAKRFARVTFLSDFRADLPKITVPTLILQCTDDIIAPVAVGEFMKAALPDSELQMIENIGHCPHLSAPAACARAVDQFLISRAL